MPKAMDHIVLNVAEVETMIAFYSEVLELAPERLTEFDEGKVPFPSLRINEDTIIDLFPKSMWEQKQPSAQGRPNLNHLCLALSKAEWDRLRQRLANHQVALEDGPVERWGAHGTGISIYFRDPEGNLVEARHYEANNASQPCLLGS